MLPEPKPLLVDDLTQGTFMYPRSRHYPFTQSFDNGGIAIGDTSKGLLTNEWVVSTDGSKITIGRVDHNTTVDLLTDTNISEVDFTFDQNMRPCVAYVANGVSKFYWYDTQQAMFVTTDYPNIRNPRVSLDDKREFNISNSDIIFAYMKGNTLCYRQQRERYTTEYELKTYTTTWQKVLHKIGMGTQNRFLFYVR